MYTFTFKHCTFLISVFRFQVVTLPPRADRDLFQTTGTVTLTRDGNYTCVASSVAGGDRVVVDTRTMHAHASIKFHSPSQEIEILETPQGFAFTLGLIAILGYIFRHQ